MSVVKALVVEDRSTMVQMFCGILLKYGIDSIVSSTVATALSDLKTYRPDIVILDSSVDNGKGMQFVTAVTPVEEEKESRKERRKKLIDAPSILVVRTVYEVVPNDCPFVKASLVRPFTSNQLVESLRILITSEEAERLSDISAKAQAEEELSNNRKAKAFSKLKAKEARAKGIDTDMVPDDEIYSMLGPEEGKEYLETREYAGDREKREKLAKLNAEIPAADPKVELARMGISYGESYVFFEERPIFIHRAVQIFSNAGFDMLLLTAARAKVARERFGLDLGAEVFTLTGDTYPLGTMIDAVEKFVTGMKYPLVAIGDLDNIIEHCGVDMTLRAIQQILSFRRRDTDFTLLVSVDGSLLASNVRKLLTEMMTEYKEV